MAAPSTPDSIDQHLLAQGLLPVGPAGELARVAMATAAEPTRDRFRGALLGTACGDALGRPAQGRTPEQIRRKWGELREFLPWYGWSGGPVGTFTDDTQLTILTGAAVLEAPDDHAGRFGATLAARLHEIRGIGMATRQAVERLIEGIPWWRSGTRSAGNGVAMRAAAAGLAFGHDLDALRLETARNAIVTHADPMAVASGVAQAYAVARLVRTPKGSLDPRALISEIASVLDGIADPGAVERRADAGPDRVRLVDRIREVADLLHLEPADAFRRTYNGAFVLESLPAALYAFLSRPADPEEAIVTAVAGGYDADTVAAMTGALAGAYHGESGLPTRWVADLEEVALLRRLGERLLERPATLKARGSAKESDYPSDRAHVAILLDRSGSMSRIADDTIGGFNSFVDEQRRGPGECRLTLIQFDSVDPHEVIYNGITVGEVKKLHSGVYKPRGMTPLLDALGTLLQKVDARAAADPSEHQLVAVITDGLENASTHFTHQQIAKMIAQRDDAGWAFVFLGANIDSFQEASTVGLGPGHADNFSFDGPGVRGAFEKLSQSNDQYRRASQDERVRLKSRLMQEARERVAAAGREHR